MNFRDKVLKAGRWIPGRGANLNTFFIGNCLRLQFPNLYRSWLRQHRAFVVDTTPNPGDQNHPAVQLGRRDDPANQIVEDDTARQVLFSIGDPTTQTIWKLLSENYDIDEIADITGLSYGSVRSRIYRLRQRLGRGDNR